MDRFSVFLQFLFFLFIFGINYSSSKQPHQVGYPYGPNVGDAQLRVGYEVASTGIQLSIPVKFYNESYDTIFVS